MDFTSGNSYNKASCDVHKTFFRYGYFLVHYTTKAVQLIFIRNCFCCSFYSILLLQALHSVASFVPNCFFFSLSQHILLVVLTCHFKIRILHRCLKYSLDMTKIPAQDTLSVLSGLASKPKSWRMTWNFVRQNWKLLYRRY